MRLRWLLLSFLLFSGWACTHTPKPAPANHAQQQKPPVAGPDLENFKKLQPLFKRQSARKEVLLTAKQKGLIGEADNGYLLLRTEKGLAKQEINQMKSLILKENKDRKKIYQFLSREDKLKKKEYQALKRNMFESYLDWDPPGVYYYKNQKWLKK